MINVKELSPAKNTLARVKYSLKKEPIFIYYSKAMYVPVVAIRHLKILGISLLIMRR
jgi:hypothetical protein